MFDPNAVPFKASTLSTYNVFEIARKLGIKNLVSASSETLLGPPFDVPPRPSPWTKSILPNLKPPTRFRFELLGQEMVFRDCVLRVSYVFSVTSECSSSSSSWSSSVYTPKERCLPAP